MTQTPIILLLLLAFCSAAFYVGRRRALSVAGGQIRNLHSLPGYYGLYVALWAALPALILFGLWSAFEGSIITQMVVAEMPASVRALEPAKLNLLVNDLHNLVSGNVVSGTPDAAMQAAAERYRNLQSIASATLIAVTFGIAAVAGWFAFSRIRPHHRARNGVERIIMGVLIASSLVAILTTVGIVLSVLFESIRFFHAVPFHEFLFGLNWSPQIAIRADQAGSTGAFGAVPLFAGTMLITVIAMVVAVPIGLMAAFYLSEYAGPKVRATAKPLLEVLAGIPTVVYGFFAALTVAPFIRDSGTILGLDVASESALAAGLVMGIMIIPFVSSLSDDVINAVPQSLRDGAYGMGATQSETIRKVIFPAALPGIVGAVLLAVSRAVGETMIVVMAAGLSSNLTANPLEAVTTVTVQIVTLLVGDQEFDSPKTLAAFALGLMLFVTTLCLNVFALFIVRKYREQYD
ncbi:phosphate ABC transporter permease subunit PstC [Nitrogeniibacter aestuarii]|uniref:phosphate ABC transporter permease subunit PstC n=1 Tax=Nitrogeniibacter aestuarii TaxID=2815343 RepID=UPI001D0FCE55|nr:phosphate ABC transporter permease subunit PstC [Nitrogeniibacter aestuarii]